MDRVRKRYAKRIQKGIESLQMAYRDTSDHAEQTGSGELAAEESDDGLPF